MSATQRLYSLLYPLPESSDGRCYLCGSPAYAPQPLKALIKPTFTDFGLARGDANAGICCACAWMMEEFNVDMPPSGTGKATAPRLYSHFLADGQHYILSKAHKADMAALLLGNFMPEVAIVAVSGQKHLGYRARVNPTGQRAGWVQFEEQAIWLDLEQFGKLFGSVAALYQARFTKDSLLTGRYKFYSDSDSVLWRSHENLLAPRRGSAVLELAVYVVTKQGEPDAERSDL